MGHALAEPGIIPPRNPRLLSLTVYAALTAIVVIGIALLPTRALQVATGAICLAFGLVDTLAFRRVSTMASATWYLTAQTLLVIGLFAVSRISDPFNFLLFVLAIQATSLLPPPHAVAWTGALFLVSAGAALLLRGDGAVINIIFNASAFALTGVYGYSLRQVELARRQNERLLAELREAQRQLRELAVAEERGRLARDLHDSARQQAFALAAQLDAARSRLRHDPEGAERHLIQAEGLVDSLRQELAALIFDLRPPALGAGGLAAALGAYAAQWSQLTGIAAELIVEGASDPPATLEAPLLRIAQEALANVSRHSGARRTVLRLRTSPGRVELQVEDDGRGFDPARASGGVGLASMRERAAALPGGALAVESHPGGGALISVRCALEGGQ